MDCFAASLICHSATATASISLTRSDIRKSRSRAVLTTLSKLMQKSFQLDIPGYIKRLGPGSEYTATENHRCSSHVELWKIKRSTLAHWPHVLSVFPRSVFGSMMNNLKLIASSPQNQYAMPVSLDSQGAFPSIHSVHLSP
ncbi:hypothetical protein OG21DRAFT_519637 [Imleria badia]|nr:hypothetical protein OG21DRAFT_519637 [Imleria badia]